MSEFVGRTGSKRVYSYPETPRGGGALAFARNSAFGPPGEGSTPVTTTGTKIPWTIELGGAPGSVDIPISPRVTGLLRVTGVVTVDNTIGAPVEVQIQVSFFGGSPYPIPAEENVVVPASGALAIPFNVLLQLPSTVNTTIDIEILVTAGTDNAIGILAESSTIDIQEVSPPTA